MIIGIPKEEKIGEYRIALIPEHVGKLVSEGHIVFLEKGAGVGCGFSDKDYMNQGAIITDKVYDCKMIVRVKEPPLSTIKQNQIIMGYPARSLKEFLKKNKK